MGYAFSHGPIRSVHPAPRALTGMNQAPRAHRAVFITFEGIEGCGKTTQAKLLAKRLREEGQQAILTAEPGGTVLGRALRAALLNPARTVDPIAEWLLFEADRAQHVRETIQPLLRRGVTVICDRFSDSTRAYQGIGRGLGLDQVDRVDRAATGGLKPDLTFLLDLPVREGLARAASRGKLTRIERERTRFHTKIRDAFLVLATREPGRIKVVDGRLDRPHAAEVVWKHVAAVLGRKAR